MNYKCLNEKKHIKMCLTQGIWLYSKLIKDFLQSSVISESFIDNVILVISI